MAILSICNSLERLPSEKKKGFGMFLSVTLIFLTFLKERILSSSLLL